MHAYIHTHLYTYIYTYAFPDTDVHTNLMKTNVLLVRGMFGPIVCICMQYHVYVCIYMHAICMPVDSHRNKIHETLLRACTYVCAYMHARGPY